MNTTQSWGVSNAAVSHVSHCSWTASNCQTWQCYSNMNHDSFTSLPVSYLKCFQKHILVYCLAVKKQTKKTKKTKLVLFPTWQPCHTFTSEQYTCFWKHLGQEKGNALTGLWFIFHQCHQVWQFDRSPRAMTDSCVRDSSALIGCCQCTAVDSSRCQ